MKREPARTMTAGDPDGSVGVDEKVPRMSLGHALGLLLLVGLGFGLYQFLVSLRGPTHNGMSVRQWLARTNRFQGFVDDPRLAQEVHAFGPEAIPAFIRGYRWATNSQGAEFNWFGLKKPAASAPRDLREHHAVQALIVLGRRYPAEMDPFFFELMKGRRRHQAITYLGFLGNRHFPLLTNLLVTHHHDSVAALNGLQGMGTNAVHAVPLIVAEIQGGRRDSHWYLNAAFALSRIGEHHPLTLPTLVEGLYSTNRNIHSYSSVALRRMTNQSEQIRPHYLRLARRPAGLTNGFDPGGRGAFGLQKLGVPPATGVPVILRRLREWTAIERGAPKKDMTFYTLRALAEYGPAARDAIPIIEREVMDELRTLAGSTDPATRNQGRSLLRQFDPWLRRLGAPIP